MRVTVSITFIQPHLFKEIRDQGFSFFLAFDQPVHD
jgi:hypothetical protein